MKIDDFYLASMAEQICIDVESLRQRHGLDHDTIAAVLLELADWYAGEPLPIELCEPDADEVFA